MDVRSQRWASVLVMGLAVLLAFAFQGSRGLWGPDEGRYSNVALQMVESGDWLIPRRHEEHMHFTKPPLTYWAIASSVTLFGHNEWALRLPSALALVGTSWLLLLLGRRLLPQRPWLPPLIYSTSLLPFFAGNLISTDGLLTLFETLAMLGFVQLWQAPELSTAAASRARLLMWSGFALAFLTKGPPGLLPLLAMWLFLFVERRAAPVGQRAPTPRLFSWTGLLLFALIALPWFVLVALRVPGLLSYLIGNEVVARVLTDAHDRNPQWYAPFTIYLPVVVLASLPWSIRLWRKLPSAWSALRQSPVVAWFGQQPIDRMLWVWLLLPLLVFCLARSRLQLYLLPLFVPFALLAGRALQEVRFHSGRLLWTGLWVLALLGLKFGAAHMHYAKDTRAIAAQVKANWQERPVEIIFVEEPALYGLRHYLNLQIERVSFGTPPDGSFDESLGEEIADVEGPRLWVTTADRVPRLIAAAAAAGQQYQQIGQHDRYVLGTLVPASPN